jgi:magnesium chelatase subunit D
MWPLPELPTHPSVLAAVLLAVDARGLGGAVLDHPTHESARLVTGLVQRLLSQGAPLRRLPIGITADRLYGGIDLAATLNTGRLVAERGVLAASDGGVLVAPMAERLGTAARTALCEVLDRGEVSVAREGLDASHLARLCVMLLDESMEDEALHPALIDRVAFRIQLDATAHEALDVWSDDVALAGLTRLVCDARDRLLRLSVDDVWPEELCQLAEACGVQSVRATLMAVRCARAHAAFQGRLRITAVDAEVAAALVLAPRATRVPVMDAAEETEPPAPHDESGADASPPHSEERPSSHAPAPDVPLPAQADESSLDAPPDDAPLPDGLPASLLRAAVQAALPEGLLERLQAQIQSQLTRGERSRGREGSASFNLQRGTPRGARHGQPRGGARLHLLATLRCAAPWQKLRQLPPASGGASNRRVHVRREDFRVRQYLERTGTTVLFVVDASGSSAVHRLAEAKGAVELLLSESYARRDRVSLLAFRGQGTEVLLPPTRALARARRVLAALPGGGGTPLASAIDAAIEQCVQARRGGSAPLVVFLTDGRANIARDGSPGRGRAEQDALAAAAHLASLRMPALFVDTSLRGEAIARRVADAMRARYVLLPSVQADVLGGLVQNARRAAGARAS